MPALGMAQETGTLLRWLKAPGDTVVKGELLMEVETDKAMVEIEAPASGILTDVTAQPGDVVPVGQVIARIVAPDEARQDVAPAKGVSVKPQPAPRVSPVAARIAREHGIDVTQIQTTHGVIQKEDVMAYIAGQSSALDASSREGAARQPDRASPTPLATQEQQRGRVLASPKARRLAREHGLALSEVRGSGPGGAVLAADVLAVQAAASVAPTAPVPETETLAVSHIWRVMVERLSQAWTTIPHFYLAREVNASRLMAWRDAKKRNIAQITYTDLLVKLVAVALQQHPRVNASWQNHSLMMNHSINIGLAMAVEAGLVVPVIHRANELTLPQITARRLALLERAQAGRLSVDDLRAGTFTISNLGMYGVDAFNAIVNPPQAAILAVSRIAERVVVVNHQPVVQPMMTLTLSCDHRVVDGARAAQFLDTLAQLIEEPLALLD